MVLAVLAIAGPASAHPVPFSYLDLHLRPNGIDGTLVAHIFDVAHDLNVDKPETLLEPTVASRNGAALIAMLSGRLQLLVDGRPLSASWSGAGRPGATGSRSSCTCDSPVDRAPGTVTVTAVLFPYDPTHQTFLNVYEGETLTQAILDAERPSFEYFAGTRQGALAVVRKIRAGRHPPHPDRPRPPAVPGRPAPARRHDPAAGRRRHGVHGRPQPDAVAGGAQHRQPAGAAHRAGHRAEHRLRRRGQPAGREAAATSAAGSPSPSASSTASASPTCCAKWICPRARSAGRCSRSTSASRSGNCWWSCGRVRAGGAAGAERDRRAAAGVRRLDRGHARRRVLVRSTGVLPGRDL